MERVVFVLGSRVLLTLCKAWLSNEVDWKADDNFSCFVKSVDASFTNIVNNKYYTTQGACSKEKEGRKKREESYFSSVGINDSCKVS